MEENRIQLTDFQFKEASQSLYKAVKDNPKDKIEVEIGDSKDLTKFQPQAKIMRWDNEVNLSVRYKDEDKSEPRVASVGGVVRWVKPDKEVRVYEKPEVGEDGGIELEVILHEKPESNVVLFSIETKGLDFYYQPEISDKEAQEYIDRLGSKEKITLLEAKRRIRPENVVGSYAVYHSAKRDNFPDKEYKTGKAFHIFRPKVIDSNSSEIWGELNVDINKKLLTIAVDEKWLEKAVYPVIVDPTFGYTSVGGSLLIRSDGHYANRFSLGVAASLSSMSVYIYRSKSTATDCYMGVYSVSSDRPSARLLYTSEFTGIADWYNKWKTETISGSSLSAADYFLVFGSSSDADIYLKYDSGTAKYYQQMSTYSYAPPSSWTSLVETDWKFSIYATYTESGGGATNRLLILTGVGK